MLTHFDTMPITQKELAERLGISRQIVGHALNGNPRVAESTRQRVMEAAQQYGYDANSNQEARAMIARRYGKRMRHDLIAVMMGIDYDGGLMRDMPYFTPLFQGIEQEAAIRSVDVALHTMRINHLPRYILEKRVDGVVAFATTSERNLGLYQDGVPLLTVGGSPQYASSLVADDYTGIRLTTQHLIDFGHRRIAYLGQVADFPTTIHRLNAYRDTMRKNGLAASEELVEATLKQPYANAGKEGMRKLCSRSTNFTALVCYNDTIAIGAIEHLRSIGIDVPRDVSVTGFDDVSLGYGLEPPLTSISFDRHAMGRRIVGVFYELLARIQEQPADNPLPLYHEVFPVELVVRGSTRRLNW